MKQTNMLPFQTFPECLSVLGTKNTKINKQTTFPDL